MGYSPWGHKKLDEIEHACMCAHACGGMRARARARTHTHTHTHSFWQGISLTNFTQLSGSNSSLLQNHKTHEPIKLV